MLQAGLVFYVLSFHPIVFNRPERFSTGLFSFFCLIRTEGRDHNEVGPLERASICHYLSGLVLEILVHWLSDKDIYFKQGHPLRLSHFKTRKAQALEPLFVRNLRR